jgi:hypothetical protein
MNLPVLFTFEAAALRRRSFALFPLPQSFALVRRNLSLIYVFETSGQENCSGYRFCSMVALAEVTAQTSFAPFSLYVALRTFLEG